jgi:hypothetical protein
MHHSAVFKDRDPLQIGMEGPVGRPLGEAPVVTECRLLPAMFAFRHDVLFLSSAGLNQFPYSITRRRILPYLPNSNKGHKMALWACSEKSRLNAWAFLSPFPPRRIKQR